MRKGSHASEETKKKMRESHLGQKHPSHSEWMKKNCPTKRQEVKDKISKANKGRKRPDLSEYNRTRVNPLLGKKRPDLAGDNSPFRRPENREKARKRWSGENNPTWAGGVSFKDYGKEFNEKLKEQIRARDGYQCRECGMSQLENRRKLDVHHIDYNKKNNAPSNLISLCIGCNSKANFSREDWTKYYKEKMK